MQQAKRTRKLLTDQQKYAAYVAMHFVCMNNGGKFKRNDKKKIAEFFQADIGCWPFVKEVPAARKSDNRPKGTLETKALKVNREVMREFFIDKVLPAIVAAWPDKEAGETIFIQQDNAKPHILPNDPEFAAAVAKTGLDIRLIQQPTCSPDLNVLDLGFFNSIQSDRKSVV